MNENQNFNQLSDEEQALAAGYVLGDLTPEEVARLEERATQNPAIAQEIHALETSYALMPQALDLIDPPTLLTAKIAQQPETLAPTPVISPTASPHSRSRWVKLFAGVAALLALLLLADNWRLRRQLQLAQTTHVDRIAAILQQPNSRLIGLTGDDSPAGGTVLFTPGHWEEVIVSLGDLPPLPPEQIYRMWLALENGEVIYCGEFDTNADGEVFIRLTPPELPPEGVKATKLFVTLDATDASPNPTGTPIIEGAI